MELRHLRYFVAVGEELHFGRAAARLHVAQPPLSRQIRDLEDELGLQLFVRNRHGASLTAAGEAFLAEVRHVFDAVERSISVARRAHDGKVGVLRIGYVGSVAYSRLPEIVRGFRARVPDVDVQLEEMSPAQQVEALLGDRLDVAFGRGPVHEPALEVATVLDEPLVAVLSTKHRLAREARLRLGMLAREPFIVTARARGPGYHDFILGICQQSGFSPRIVQEGTHFDVLCLVAAGIGVALVPLSLREVRRGDVVYRPLRERVRTQLVMLTRKGSASPVVRQFVDDIRMLDRDGLRRRRNSR